MHEPSIQAVESACRRALASAELRRVDTALRRNGIEQDWTESLVAQVSQARDSLAGVLAARSAIAAHGVDPDSGHFERYLLVSAALKSLRRLAEFPLDGEVKRLLCAEYTEYARAEADTRPEFVAGHAHFPILCKLATLRRFPAGIFDWEMSGIPRSLFVRLRGKSRFQVPAAVLQMGGRAPVFWRHTSIQRGPTHLTRESSDRALLLMAKCLAMHPDVKGLVACSWLVSPDTHRVSPRLSWVNDTFRENGATISIIGPASPDCGVFARSETRRRLYEEGKFKPTIGIALWPRKAMLEWAEAHPNHGEP